MALGLVGGWLTLRTARPPEPLLGVGVELPHRAKPGRGFVLGLGVRTRGCDEPVHVTAVFGGSAEYWRDAPDVVPPDFTLVVPDPRVRVLGAHTGSDASDVLKPLEPSAEEPVEVATRRDGLSTYVSGRVPDWSVSTAPVVVELEADWIEPRGLGSCYLRLPALVGRLSMFAAQQASGDVDRNRDAFGSAFRFREPRTGLYALVDPARELSHGSTSVSAGPDHQVAGDLSFPSPDVRYRELTTWTCDHRTDQPAERYESQSTGTYPVAAIERQLSSDCSAVAVIVTDSPLFERDLLLLLIGALLSVGAAIVTEVGLLSRREPSP